jgi:CheY-like chemotaxis protein
MGKILIVEDDADAGEGLAKIFTKAGHEPIVATDGRRALSHVINDTPDVVLLDLLMPEMDGPSFLEVVRSYLRLQSLPVVVLTGLPESPMIERAQVLKVNAVLAKAKATSQDILRAVEEAMVQHPG